MKKTERERERERREREEKKGNVSKLSHTKKKNE